MRPRRLVIDDPYRRSFRVRKSERSYAREMAWRRSVADGVPSGCVIVFSKLYDRRKGLGYGGKKGPHA